MNDEGERLNLINRNGDGGSATSADHVPSATDDKDVIHPMGSFIVMFGFSLGTGILLISYSLRQLGLIPWFCALTVIILLQFMATHMINVCTRQMIEERGCSTIRDPYQATAELAGGRILRQFSLILMYTTNFIIAVSLFLLSASTITTFIPIRALSHAHNIRVWVSIVIAVLTPVTFLGTYSDLKIPSIIAVTTALISATAVVINCILKLYIYPNNTKQVVYVKESAFLPLGSLIFMTAGASITVSNLTVLTPAPRKLLNPIAATYILIFLIYMIVGPVPYYTFHENVMSSILATMSAVNNGAGDSDVGVFRVITILVQVLMLIHLTMASILAVNPIQLLLEDSLNIPQDFNWKRVVARSSIMLLAAGVCLAMPEFEVAIGLAGGVPLALLGIILPIFFYTRIFEIHLTTKIFLYIVILLILVFVSGNLVESIRKLVT